MIEAVSTLSVQSAALRSQPQQASAVAVSQPSSAADQQFFISSRVRIDNLLDVAILEFRSGETGDVIRQYPTESQIRAFQRAGDISEQIRSQQAEQQASPVAAEAAPVSASVTVSPAPTPAAVSPSSPVSSSGVSVAVSGTTSSYGQSSGSSSTSVTV